jgi:hypothetical protein
MPVEGINWAKEWMDFTFSFMATVGGVLLAFQIDRMRERAKLKANKRKLIQSLLEEIQALDDYIRQNPNLQLYANYELPTEVIEETINDQLDHLNQNTNKLLKQLRIELWQKMRELDEWAELNKSAIGIGKYPTQTASYNAANIKGNWSTFANYASKPLSVLKTELEKELAKF